MRVFTASEEPEDPASPTGRATSARAGDELALGRYALGARLGSGGFGTVYAGEDLRLRREVAVKVVDGRSVSPERARREAMAAARLDHPGIVSVFDAGEERDRLFLISELVRGRTLAELERAGDLSDRDVLRIGLALADALGHAHARGVVHRDVKPQNVIVPDGEAPSWRGAAKLTDFGIASLADDAPLTQPGDVLGTLAYMAPEQAAGEPVDERADAYALALVLYEALAGIHPVRAGTPAATARRVGTRLAPLGRHRADLPEDLRLAIDDCLEPHPDDRETLAGLAQSLAATLNHVSDADGTIAPHPSELPVRSLPRGAGRLLAAAAAAGASALALEHLVPGRPVPLAPALVAVGAGVALLPRAGWLAAGCLVAYGLLTAPRPLAGAAALVLVAMAATALALRRRGLLWSVPLLAPLLGLAGLAGAYPAVAGRVGGAGARAALGALGAVWLLIAEPLTRVALLLDPLGRRTVPRSARDALESVLGGLVSAPGALLIAVWALAALSVPWVVRGRSLPADAVAAILWASGLAAATLALAGAGGAVGAPAAPRGLLAGTVAAFVVAAWRRR